MARNLVRFDPFADLERLERELFAGPLPGRSLLARRMPTTDVYTEDDKRMVVEAHLPHFGKDDVHVTVDNGALVIQAERREREEDKKKQYVVRESSTSFFRSIVLPDQADESALSASFEKGVLRVVVPFRESPKPKEISITAAE